MATIDKVKAGLQAQRYSVGSITSFMRGTNYGKYLVTIRGKKYVLRTYPPKANALRWIDKIVA